MATPRRPGAIEGWLGSRDGYYVNAILHVEPGTSLRFSARGDARLLQDTLVAILRSVGRPAADSSGADR